jgi:hypothetical protein
VYAHVCAATGWTWEYVGERLTLPRLYALQAHWDRYPPVHISVALFAGIKPATPKAAANDELAAYIDTMPSMKLRRAGAQV